MNITKNTRKILRKQETIFVTDKYNEIINLSQLNIIKTKNNEKKYFPLIKI